MRHVKKLMSIASPETGGALLLDGASGMIDVRICDLLRIRNGCYAFQGALHIYSSMEVLFVSQVLGRSEYAVSALPSNSTPFAENVFGEQFFLGPDGCGRLDMESGEIEGLGDNIDEWARMILEDYEYLTGSELAFQWQKKNRPLNSGERLFPIVPFVMGGEFEVSNLKAKDWNDGFRARESIYVQVRDVPDGQKITFEVVE